jgi:uncharacterized protein (TIGR02246 family)
VSARAVADAFLKAYNDKDLEALAALLHEDLHMVHYGTDFDLTGRAPIMERMTASATGALADRHFNRPRHVHEAGDTVIVEHEWEATATADVPGRAAAGERVAMELCTILTVRDGVIVEYREWG